MWAASSVSSIRSRQEVQAAGRELPLQQKTHYTATGVGAILEYDSRDFIPNPFGRLRQSAGDAVSQGLGNCGRSLWRTTFTADYYGQVWKGGILAADSTRSSTPRNPVADAGPHGRFAADARLLSGRYTDNDMITFQVELRQRIWRRIGCTFWGGAGNVFSDLERFDWSDATQLQRRPALGIEETGQCATRLRLRQRRRAASC